MQFLSDCGLMVLYEILGISDPVLKNRRVSPKYDRCYKVATYIRQTSITVAVITVGSSLGPDCNDKRKSRGKASWMPETKVSSISDEKIIVVMNRNMLTHQQSLFKPHLYHSLQQRIWWC